MATTAPNPEPATAAHAASATPILNKEDEHFLQRLVSHKLDHDTNNDNDGDGPRPPLPPRARTPELTWEWDSDTETYVPDTPITTTIAAAAAAVAGEDSGTATPAVPGKEADTKDTATREVDTKEKEGDKKDKKEKETDKDKDNKKFSARFTRLLSRVKKPKDDTATNTSSNNKLAVPSSPSSPPAVDDTDLAAALASLSPPSTPDPSKDTKDTKKKSKSPTDPSSKIPAQIQPLLQQFILILRDLTTGVPTAANDLRTLLTDRDAALAKGFHKLPSPMQKLVRQLPEKITASLGPEVLAAAAEAQGLGAGAAAASAGGMKGAAKMLLPRSLSDLAVTPATVASMFRAIVNALKLRFPAFVGTGALWSVAVFLLLFVLWYCFKRGREVRLAEEAAAAAEAEVIAAGVKEGETVMPAGMVLPVAVEVPEVILEEPVAEGEAAERVKVPA